MVIADEKEGVDTSILSDRHLRDTAYAVLDLDMAASTQIVFKPSFASRDQNLEGGEKMYDLNFGGQIHVPYYHTYCGYVKVGQHHW